MASAQTEKLNGRARKALEETLVRGEQVRMVVPGRENQSLVLTDRRLIMVNGSMMFRGADARQLTDVAGVTSGMSGISMAMRNGQEFEFGFWPTGTNRSDAKQLVQMVRNHAAAPPAPAASSNGGVADQLVKLEQLRRQGVLSDAEFATQKARLLA